MVVNDIEDHAEAGLVKSLNHLLELLDAGYRVERICRVRTLDCIEIERFIAPVVLVVLEVFLVDGSEICRRKKLDVGHAKFLEVVDTCCETVRILCTFLGHSQVLTLVCYA